MESSRLGAFPFLGEVAMPRCRKCGQDKADLAFAWRWRARGVRQPVCRACRKVENAQWYARHGAAHRANIRRHTAAARSRARAYIASLLAATACVDCGERDPLVLEFDHVRGRKYKDVSKLVAEGYGLTAIQNEIAKCDVRCANCHRRRTARAWR